jgi:hypothetical protein
MTPSPRPCSPTRPASVPGEQRLIVSGRRICRPVPLLAVITAALLSAPLAARAGIRFENCVRGADGSLSCDTVPTGNTYLNDKDAQYGLLQQASPGWSEFNPYQGYDEDFGGGMD